MPPRYHLDDVVFENGERLPILCDREAGAPLLRPNLWVLSIRPDLPLFFQRHS